MPPGSGSYFVKSDNDLQVSGSTHVRGAIYEVTLLAMVLGRKLGLMTGDAGPMALATPRARAAFSAYKVVVASSGGLGLAVGRAAQGLGFRAEVHMPRSARSWVERELRASGITVVLHDAGFRKAHAAARAACDGDPACYLVDEKQSRLLFFGASAAAAELQAQLVRQNIQIGADRPLFLYLPCGSGSAPGGIALGARQMFGPNVHCFFAEPVCTPRTLAALASPRQGTVNVRDMGLRSRTAAAGLSVPELSPLVAEAMDSQLSGVFTVEDDTMFRWLAQAQDRAGLQLDPGAASSLAGPEMLMRTEAGEAYLRRRGLTEKMGKAVHVMWATAGGCMPDADYERCLMRGRMLQNSSRIAAE
jgi:D-serine dehydratase